MATTFDPNDPNKKSIQWVLSNGNLTATHDAGYDAAASVLGTVGFASGDHEAKFTLDNAPSGGTVCFGISSDAQPLIDNQGGAQSAGVYGDGQIAFNNFQVGGNIGPIGIGDVVTVRYKDRKVYFRRNQGLWNGSSSADPSTGIGGLDVDYIRDGNGNAVDVYPSVFANKYTTSTTADFSQWEVVQQPPAEQSSHYVIDPHLPPYNAKGDAVGMGDGVVTEGTLLSSASYTFKASDVNKTLWIGTDSTPRTITGVENGKARFDIAHADYVSGETFQWLMGTDDTAAIQAALDDARDIMGNLFPKTTLPNRPLTFVRGAMILGAVVQLRSGRGYIVGNPGGSGRPSALVLYGRVGLVGSGASFANSAIHLKPGSSGYVLANQHVDDDPFAEPNGAPWTDFMHLGHLTVYCYASTWNPGQTDGIKLRVNRDNFPKVDAFNRLVHLHVYNAGQDGIHLAGRGEFLGFDLNSFYCNRHGIHIADLDDSRFFHVVSGAAQKAGIKVHGGGPLHFVGCKSYRSGEGGGDVTQDCVNWWITSDSYKTGLSTFTSCEGQEARGSSWLIESGRNSFSSCFALDPGRDGMNGGTLPPKIAGVHLRGMLCNNNQLDFTVTPTLGAPSDPVPSGSAVPNTWGLAQHALYVDEWNATVGGPQLNRGDILAAEHAVRPDGVTYPGITYPAGGGMIGKHPTQNSNKNPNLRVNGTVVG